jgi:acetyl-CoA carboxylase biotin carboxyl carrier protein
VDLKDIKAIIDLMKKNAITEFELERDDFKIKLRRNNNGGSNPEDTPMISYLGPAPMAAALPAPAPVTAPIVVPTVEQEIKSPMVGTFYRAPSPEAGPYVDIGTQITAETVICIIEAMKVMNEIKAETSGIVTQVLAQNSQPVEYGQPLFKIRPL